MVQHHVITGRTNIYESSRMVLIFIMILICGLFYWFRSSNVLSNFIFFHQQILRSPPISALLHVLYFSVIEILISRWHTPYPRRARARSSRATTLFRYVIRERHIILKFIEVALLLFATSTSPSVSCQLIFDVIVNFAAVVLLISRK